MGEEFHSIIKLVSGEEIFSLVSVDENDGDPVVVLQNPLIMKMFTNSNGAHIKVKPWIDLSTEEFFMIKSDKILTMTESKDQKLIEIYNNFITTDEPIEIHSSNGYTRPTTKMGYVSSVKAARKHLETLFNLKNIKES
jgi:hypothetical protein